MRTAPGLLCVTLVICVLGACSSGGGGSNGSSTTSNSAASTAPTTASKASGAHWTTYYRDVGRTGLATDGPSPANRARKQWTSPSLDGDVYAQPLLVGSRVVIATENDTIYSLNAATGAIVWQRHLGAPVPGSSLPCGNVDPVGITSTPVVDDRTNRIYAVGMVPPKQHMLFELDAGTGRLVGSARVDADGSDPAVQNQRSALTLSNGTIFIPYGGRFGDCGDYHGRVVTAAVSASGIGTVASYTLPTQREGGFWAPPGAVLATNGDLFLASGNSSSSGAYDYGNSVVRLSPT